MELKTGITFEKELLVTQAHCAKAVGSGSLEVLATPVMVSLMEEASANCILSYIDPEYTSVGTFLSISHLSATPVGMSVRARATLKEIEGKKLTFEVEAFDEAGKIGEGTHQRFLVNAERFLKKTYEKKGNCTC